MADENEKTSKVKIVSWCLMVALCVFAGALCLYFFVFNHAPNERGKSIYNELNNVLLSDNQLKVNSGLGEFGSSSNAQTYAESSASGDLGKKFKAIFLCYCVDHEIVDTYKYEIAYLSNADYKLSQKLDNAVIDYEKALSGVQSYLAKFNTAYISSSTSEETKGNFAYLLEDLDKLEIANHTLAMGIVEYVGNTYYGYEEKLDKYVSEKYMLTYALSFQSKTAYTVRNKLFQNGVDTYLYNDTVAQLNGYKSSKALKFEEQISDTNMMMFLCIMISNCKDYIPFFESANKSEYYQNATNATIKSNIGNYIANALGLGGRI